MFVESSEVSYQILFKLAEMASIMENLISCINNNMTTVCQNLEKLWVEIWDEEEHRKRKEFLLDEFTKNTTNLITELIVSETNMKSKYVSRINELLSLCQELEKYLGVKIEQDDLAELPFHSLALELNKRVQKYQNIKEERLLRRDELIAKEEELNDKLGFVPISLPFSPIPSENELEMMDNHVKALEDEEEKRKNIMLDHRGEILEMYNNLGSKPLLPFEKEFFSENFVNMKLNDSHISHAANLKSSLQQQVQDAQDTIGELTQKLKDLWSYLDIDTAEQEQFLRSHAGYSFPIIEEMKKELDKLKQIKRANIGQIIMKMKDVLNAEWDKCLMSEDDRSSFIYFNEESYNEDLAELFQVEINKVRSFYNENEKLFELYNKHDELFKKSLELEAATKNANRYYNRGGQLLQEEKRRKKLQKDLPIVVEELKSLLIKFREENEREFTVFGESALNKLELQYSKQVVAKSSERLRPKVLSVAGSSTKRCLPPSGDGGAPKQGRYTPCSSKLKVEKENGRSAIKRTLKFDQKENRRNTPLHEKSASVGDLTKALNSVVDFRTPSKPGSSQNISRTPGARTPQGISYMLRRSQSFSTQATNRSMKSPAANTRAPLSAVKKNKLPFLV